MNFEDRNLNDALRTSAYPMTLVPKLQLGNADLKAQASYLVTKPKLPSRGFPSWSSHRYTQVPLTQKRRHSGMDCRNPEPKDGNLPLAQVLDSGKLPAPRFTSL